MTATLDQHIAALKDGEELLIGPADDIVATVSYHSEQANGDDGRPARGFTVGYFFVHSGPNRRPQYEHFRHSPHGPGLSMAKPYAAKKAAEFVQKMMKGAA